MSEFYDKVLTHLLGKTASIESELSCVARASDYKKIRLCSMGVWTDVRLL